MKGKFFFFAAFVTLFPELALAADPPGTKSTAQAILHFLTQGEVAMSFGGIILAVVGYRMWANKATWEDALKFIFASILVYASPIIIIWLVTLIRKSGG